MLGGLVGGGAQMPFLWQSPVAGGDCRPSSPPAHPDLWTGLSKDLGAWEAAPPRFLPTSDPTFCNWGFCLFVKNKQAPTRHRRLGRFTLESRAARSFVPSSQRWDSHFSACHMSQGPWELRGCQNRYCECAWPPDHPTLGEGNGHVQC